MGHPFIDVGMGIDLTDDALGGILRVTTSTPQKRTHVWEKDRIPFSDGDGNDEYSRNIQIADLNALNAALAVIKWKKLFGFTATWSTSTSAPTRSTATRSSTRTSHEARAHPQA